MTQPMTEQNPTGIEELADSVRHAKPLSPYWLGFNDGIDALVAALSEQPTQPTEEQ